VAAVVAVAGVQTIINKKQQREQKKQRLWWQREQSGSGCCGTGSWSMVAMVAEAVTTAGADKNQQKAAVGVAKTAVEAAARASSGGCGGGDSWSIVAVMAAAVMTVGADNNPQKAAAGEAKTAAVAVVGAEAAAAVADVVFHMCQKNCVCSRAYSNVWHIDACLYVPQIDLNVQTFKTMLIFCVQLHICATKPLLYRTYKHVKIKMVCKVSKMVSKGNTFAHCPMCICVAV
jgi:hypothetical protein